MTAKSLCYFLKFDDGQPQVQTSDFQSLDDQALHGLFSFIYYNNSRLMVVGELQEYGSRHHGLASVVEALKKQAMSLRHHFFFSPSRMMSFPQNAPTLGGGILFAYGRIILFHFKSGGYSLDNTLCHDSNPNIHELIQSIGLPEECLISVDQAEKFEREYLPVYFQPNGQYAIPDEQLNCVREVVQFTYQKTDEIPESHVILNK